MAPAVRRRLTPVHFAHQLIEAINFIRTQKQIPNFDRISRQLQRNAEITPRRCKEHLNNAVSDGLILEYTAVGNKGSRTGLEQEGYRLPQPGEGEEVLNDGHDWYCFECHGPGEVHECGSCFRVYHQGCTRDDTAGDSFTCSICWANRKKSKMRKKMLNTLLSYTMIHLKETTKELYKLGPKTDPEDMQRYVFKKMDLHKMEQKVQASKYKCLDEFLADARIILHNCTLLFGEEKGGITDLSTVMVKACKYDIEEIDLCANCYYMSNAKPEDWFCQPCNPPHDLVFAKQKGYCYWPAKIVKDLGGKYDVRFFGGWHQRAVIPAEYTKPITTDVKKLAVKKTGSFTNAMKELKKHQKLLDERERELEATNGMREEEEEEEEEDTPVKNEDEQGEDEDEGEKENTQEEEEEEEEEQEESEEEEKRKSKSTPKRKSKAPAKRGVKRSREETEETEDDFDNRQVTSTSVDRQAKKRKRNSIKKEDIRLEKNSVKDQQPIPHSFSKCVVVCEPLSSKMARHWSKEQSGQDESIQVTSSSVDKISPSPPVATMNAATQTTTVKTEHCSMQTETAEEPKLPVKIDVDPKTEEEDKLNDISEDRMAKVIADLTQRLEEKFEDEKSKALKEQSDRLTEDFGKDKQQAVERTIANMNQNLKQEVEKARKMGEETTRAECMEEIKKLNATHKEAIEEAKKKQWCFNCGKESMYHCCWNTSYCTLKCQNVHWHKEHKRECRRKRPATSAT